MSRIGYRFDCAVHLFFINNNIVRNVFDKEESIKHPPIAYNFYYGKWLKHPIIHNLNPLETEEKCELIESFLSKDSSLPIKNYQDWLLGSYGTKLTERFYNIYTRKYWTTSADQLSTSWVGNRLEVPDLHKILYGAFESDTGVDYYAKEMRYPKKGGYI